jgi:hypothetical protein
MLKGWRNCLTLFRRTIWHCLCVAACDGIYSALLMQWSGEKAGLFITLTVLIAGVFL